MTTIEDQIRATIEKIRPFIQRDGGDIEYVDFKDGVVYLRMGGACSSCSLVDTTINDGVEIILIEEVPGVIRVEIVA